MRTYHMLALVAAATADGNATKCEPFRIVSDHNGFGNALFGRFVALMDQPAMSRA